MFKKKKRAFVLRHRCREVVRERSAIRATPATTVQIHPPLRTTARLSTLTHPRNKISAFSMCQTTNCTTTCATSEVAPPTPPDLIYPTPLTHGPTRAFPADPPKKHKRSQTAIKFQAGRLNNRCS